MITLKNVMLINAVSSGATGAGLLFASKVVADIFGINQTQPFVGVGIFLVAFAAVVYLVSRQNPMNANAVRLLIAGDTLWVVTSLVIVLFQVFDISMLGYFLIGAVALWVAAMAYLQFKGLNQTIKSN
jgi:hypothetical protein